MLLSTTCTNSTILDPGLVLNHVLFSLEQAVIRIFTPSNVCAMTNLLKAIDLRCPPIMQIHCLSWWPVKFLISSLIPQMAFLLNLIKLVIKCYRR